MENNLPRPFHDTNCSSLIVHSLCKNSQLSESINGVVEMLSVVADNVKLGYLLIGIIKNLTVSSIVKH